MFWITTFLVIAILIGANAIYVAAEFSTVSSRPSRLSQYADEGNHTARVILDIVEHPHKLDAYVATCQVGITLSSLVLGYYGQAQLSDSVTQILAKLGWGSEAAAESISATVILIILSIFQVWLGELVPKNIGIQIPERLAILTNTIMRWSGVIFNPLIWLFNGSGLLLMRIFNLEPDSEPIGWRP